MTDRKISLKSGYGKYLGVDKSGLVTGRVDAITPLEQFEPVWQEIEGITKCALLAANGAFVGFNAEGNDVYFRDTIFTFIDFSFDFVFIFYIIKRRSSGKSTSCRRG